MNVICIETAALYACVEKVIDQLGAQKPIADKWISAVEAMLLLRIKSKTTLLKLREEGKIRATQPSTGIILYDRASIDDYLEDFAYETFEMP